MSLRISKSFKTHSEKLPPTYKEIQTRATPTAPPLWLIFIKKFKIKSMYHSAAPPETERDTRGTVGIDRLKRGSGETPRDGLERENPLRRAKRGAGYM